MYSAEQSGGGQSPTHGPERGCQPATFAKKMSAAKTAANLAREEWPACGTGKIGGGFWGWTMVDSPGQGCWADKTNRNSLDGGERATGPLSPYPVAWTAITRIARPDTRRRILAPVRRRSTGFFLNGIEIGTPPYGHVAIIGCDGLIQRGRARAPGPTRSIYAAAASASTAAGKTKSAAFCASDAARKIARLSSLSAFSQPST